MYVEKYSCFSNSAKWQDSITNQGPTCYPRSQVRSIENAEKNPKEIDNWVPVSVMLFAVCSRDTLLMLICPSARWLKSESSKWLWLKSTGVPSKPRFVKGKMFPKPVVTVVPRDVYVLSQTQ